MAGEITLTITARPLKVAFLVGSSDDLRRATTLFTHLWGGIGGALIPLPGTEESPYFARALSRYDPDLILCSTSEVPEPVARILQGVPAPLVRVTDDSIKEHVEGLNRFHTPIGDLPHTISALSHLHPIPLGESNVRILGEGAPTDGIWHLSYGAPSDRLQAFLTQRVGASRYREPQSVEEVVRTCLIATHVSTPISLTGEKIGISKSGVLFSSDELSLLESDRIDSSNAVNIFLAAPGDLDSSVAFWNSRRAPLSQNRYLLPLDCFFAAPDAVLSALIELGPLNAIHIFCATSHEGAESIRSVMSRAVHDHQQSIPISVCYAGFRYAMPSGTLSWGSETTNTRSIADDGLVRYTISTAPPFSNRAAFGYDASIELSTGHKPALSRNPLGSRLLLNSEDRM